MSAHRLKKRIIKTLLIALSVLLILSIIFMIMICIPKPDVDKNLSPSSYTRKKTSKGYTVNNSRLIKNEYGIYEMYLEGDDYERGLIYGVLAKELIEKQESFFVERVNELVPNKIYRFFLKMLVGWFNKDIYKHIPEENLREIYGVSQSFSDKYDYVAPKYYRILNYHAAHDIGHALNDYSLVGCTSFAVNNKNSEDSSLLIARNFDFYLGEGFAEDKLLVFVNPKKGYKYASYSWAGLTGVVSGMNEKGLSVTINASKSDIPFASKTPISILAREILQYSKNIAEATAIAKKRETFVSEALLIGSTEDDNAVLIEKSPKKIDVYNPKDYLICANHYQGTIFMKDSINLENIEKSDSKYRYDRVNELLYPELPLNHKEAVEILRNKEGVNNAELGYGNPKALNQLLAHHAIMFKPQKLQMWVSTNPYQLGKFICYDLKRALAGDENNKIDSLAILPDSFLLSPDYKKYELYKITKQKISNFTFLGLPVSLTEKEIEEYIKNNPKNYITYMSLGDYFKKKKDYSRAISYYEESLKYEVASINEREKIKSNIEHCNKKLKD